MTGLQQKQASGFDDEAAEAGPSADVSTSKKAPGAFRTISEVADELDVQQHVLRFWETKFTQVKPLKRGGGRRYYRPEDVALLKRIHTLLYTEGYTIKGVQKLLKTNGKAQMISDGAPAQSAYAAPAARCPVPANEESPRPAVQASVPAAEAAPVTQAPVLTDKQRSILQAMLGDLRDLRDMISAK